MQKILISAWVAFVVVMLISVGAQAQDSHPIYDNSPISDQGSHPIYDSAPAGDSHPIYDNTLPPQVGSSTGVGRSINNLNSVLADLSQTPPDPAGRRNLAIQHAAAALQELQGIQETGE